MRAIVITHPGGPEVLQPGDVATPVPAPGRILVRVKASAVNRADLLQRRGLYPAPAGWPQEIPGLEYAGVVEDSGERVMGLVGGGGYAEYVVVNARETVPIPAGLSFEQAAAIPEVFFTAYDALHNRLHVRRGETVLIHAVASGVGTAAAQLAKQLGCFVIGTARSQWKLERVKPYGVDLTIDVSREDWVETVHSKTEGRGVDAVVDLVGGDYLGGNVKSLATLGRICVIGTVAGRSATLDMGMLLGKRATIVGTAMRSRSLEEKIQIAEEFKRDVLPLFERGKIVPVVDRVMDMKDAGEAHRLLEQNETVGKIVLRGIGG